MSPGDRGHTPSRNVTPPVPREVTYEITHRCNFSCVHCYCPSEAGEELAEKEIRKLLGNLARAGVLHVTFTGGEPFMRRCLFNVMEEARAMRFSVGIITNGSLLDADGIQRLKDLGPTQVSVSVYGASEETYRRISGRRGMWIRVMRAIDGLVEAGVKLDLKAPILKENFEEVDEMIRSAEERGLGIKLTTAITTALDGSKEPTMHTVSPDDVCDLVRRGIIRMKKVKRENWPLCNAGFTSPAIGPDGIVYPCLEIRRQAGRLPDEDFREIWRHSDVLEEYRNMDWGSMERCLKCAFHEHCLVCPAAFIREGGRRGPVYICRVMKAVGEAGLFPDTTGGNNSLDSDGRGC